MCIRVKVVASHRERDQGRVKRKQQGLMQVNVLVAHVKKESVYSHGCVRILQ